MAILKNSSTFVTSFVLTRDVEDIVGQINEAAALRATPGAPLTVYYLGEAHNVDFDIKRRQKVFDALRDDAKIILTVERTLVKPDEASNLVLEMNDLKSSDDGRNKQIVGLLEEKLQGTPTARVIVFFYGQEHESHVCKYMLKELDKTLTLNWVTCLPIEMSLKSKLDFHPSLFSTVGKRPVGYCDRGGEDFLLRLLEKGYVLEPFNLDLYSGESAQRYLPKESIYAVYFKNDTYAAHSRKAVESEGTSGVLIRRFNGAHTCVAKQITKAQIAKAESGKLDV